MSCKSIIPLNLKPAVLFLAGFVLLAACGNLDQSIADPAETIVEFHDAMESGDKDRMVELLSPDVIVYETGYVESSRAEYESYHLPADMAFSQAMSREVLAQDVYTAGNLAYILSETRTTGTYNGKHYDKLGIETVVLQKTDEGWKISHIHWSSRNAGE